jgi:adenine deaminase
VGTMRINDAADCIIVEDLEQFNILQTIIEGEIVYDGKAVHIPAVSIDIINNFSCDYKTESDFLIPASNTTIQVIEALDGQLITNKITTEGKIENGVLVSDIEKDILQISVVNRYKNAKVANAFIKNFGLQRGAIASTVAHDCHNIIAVGCTTKEIVKAVNALIDNKGGIVVIDGDTELVMPLPIAGIMSDKPAEEIGALYQQLDKKTKEMGCTLTAPFMTLSFMALLVIPNIKLSDLGLFDGQKFEFIA